MYPTHPYSWASGEHPHGFKNYTSFLENLTSAINDEASAIHFYHRLLEMNANPIFQTNILHAYHDEQKHLRMFTELYHRLTGLQATVKVEVPSFSSYKEGIYKAFEMELDAAEKYREMYLNTQLPEIRDLLFETMTDEQEHAQRFNFIYHQV